MEYMIVILWYSTSDNFVDVDLSFFFFFFCYIAFAALRSFSEKWQKRDDAIQICGYCCWRIFILLLLLRSKDRRITSDRQTILYYWNSNKQWINKFLKVLSCIWKIKKKLRNYRITKMKGEIKLRVKRNSQVRFPI
mgnify:CR=1 FL=1